MLQDGFSTKEDRRNRIRQNCISFFSPTSCFILFPQRSAINLQCSLMTAMLVRRDLNWLRPGLCPKALL